MKIAILSDQHFNAFKAFATYDNGVNSRLAEIIGAFNWAVSDAKTNGCELLLDAGDSFQTRGVMRPSVFNRVVEATAAAAATMPIVKIPGNHDMENYRGGATAIETLGMLNNVYVFRGPGILTVRDLTVAGVPYIHDHSEFLKAVEDLIYRADTKVDCLLIHQGIDDFGHAGMPETGLTAAKLTALFDGPVFCGHYHTPNAAGNVISPGSLVQHSFGDSGDRGYWIWDTDLGGIDFHPVPGPKFVTVTTQAEANGASGCYVRVISETVKAAEKLKTAAMKAGAKGVVAKVNKRFSTAHENTLKLGTPREMMIEWMRFTPEYKGKEDRLMNLLEEICEGAQDE